MISLTDKDGFVQTSVLPGTYEFEILNAEGKMFNIEAGLFSEADYPFTMKPKFSTLGFAIENCRQEELFSSIPDDIIGVFRGFNPDRI